MMKKNYLLYLSILFILGSFIIGFFPGIFSGNSRYASKMQNQFFQKIELTNKYISKLSNVEFGKAARLSQKLEDNNISVLIYQDNKLTFWSDKDIPINHISKNLLVDHTFVKLANYTYYIIERKDSINQYYGLILLESSFPYQNRFLRNGIIKDFQVPNGKIFSLESPGKGYIIKDEKGIDTFKVIIQPQDKSGTQFTSKFSSTLFFAGILLVLLFLRLFFLTLLPDKRKLWILPILAVLVICRLILVYSGILTDRFYLFSPFIYATRVAPTFGDLILNSLLFLFICYLVFKYLKIREFRSDNSYLKNFRLILINLIFVFVLVIAQNISFGMISHSSLNILLENISQLSLPVIIVYVLFGVNYLGVFLLGLWVFKQISPESKLRTILNCLILLLIVFVICHLLQYEFDIYTVIFGVCLYIVISVLKEKIYSNAIFSSLVLLFAVFSIYILLFIIHFNSKKDILQKTSFAISLSNERDPIAEYLFDDLTAELKNDTHLVNSLNPERFDLNQIYNYLTKNYFTGYWKKYDLIITICSPFDGVLIGASEENNWYHCYDYFNDYVSQSGIEIVGSDFFYLNNYSGMISYVGWIKFNGKFENEVSLFLELESKLRTAPLGYPELLLDEKLQQDKRFASFSAAKYFKNRLVSQSGDFQYSLNSKNFETDSVSEFFEVTKNNYNHLVYRIDKNNMVVISEKEISVVEIVVMFSYFFVLYYLSSIVMLILFIPRYRVINFRNNLRNRIQFAIIFILIISLVMIAGSTIWFNIRKYNQTQMANLKEKMQSTYAELDRRLAREETLSWQWKSTRYDNLNQLLTRVSDLFYCDINLYNPHGDLLATSRPEIFNLGLQNEKMDPHAFSKLHFEQLAFFVHRESINKLNYQSAYIPLTNADGALIAYINIPYFTRQKELQEDITTLTVAILNIYVLLILFTIIVAVLISEQITKPLEMLQARFRIFTLGGKYEQISYKRDDEIGRLVEEYNKMVLELERSVELLAKSERETAWREMAKQVAHEIKNPLTPMRLSVQQLQRAWDDKNEDFGQYLKRVSKTIIEQIDTLSLIASEFSNFAKMPVAKLENVDVGEILTKTVELFHGTENIEIELQKSDRELHILADAEQLNRVFINIIKNGIQSIPDERSGEISVVLYSKEDKAIIEIRDNGKGIPEDVRQKMFKPNFTTKTSGMGLGLAIVQNILEQIEGEITYKTRVGHGTTFIISLPLID